MSPRLRNLHRLLPILAAGSILWSVAACGGDGTGPDAAGPGTPPSLPTASSLDFDFDLFVSNGGSALSTAMTGIESPVDLGRVLSAEGNAADAVGTHFFAASLTVALAHAITVLHVAIPAAVFAAAENSVPSLEDDGRWHWRYSAAHGGENWGAHLAGIVQGGDALWDIRVTASGTTPPLDDFLLFSGRSRQDGASGMWSLYDPQSPGSSVEVARIEWSAENDSAHEASLRLTTGPNAADVLTMSSEGSARLVTYFDASENQTFEVGWDAVTREGWIFSIHYNNGQRSCWDANLNNTTCS